MKFSRVIGNVDEKLVQQAEDKLSQIFLELGTRYDNEHCGSGLGGDPMIFTLLYPVEHVCTLNMPTAATDGKRYYWNPKFVLKQSKIGLRIICGHESWHAMLMHPQRRGFRIPKLWNIAVDYIVNGTVMEDFSVRKRDPAEMFSKHLGKFITLSQYAEMLKNPFKQIKGLEDLPEPKEDSTSEEKVELPLPNEDRVLTDKEIKELEQREKKDKCYFADPALEEYFKRPENIYDYLYGLLPKCPKCGRIGIYKLPNKNKKKDKGEQQPGKDQKDDHNHGDGEPCDDNCPGNSGCPDCGKGCPECGGGYDIFGFGDCVDDHMDTEESEEKLAKRVSDAIETARKMAGYIPAGLEEELGILTAPRITWQDILRTRLLKARTGNGRNDWTRFRSRAMFSGLLVPKRKSFFASFGCLLDTSGSMSKEDMSFGISQLASLDENAEGTIVNADAEIYWDKATKIRKANVEELSKLKICGRGGTQFADFFKDYEKKIGKCDFLIVITDGYLMDTDIAEMIDPGIDVFWLVTSGTAFKAPFGRVLDLRN